MTQQNKILPQWYENIEVAYNSCNGNCIEKNIESYETDEPNKCPKCFDVLGIDFWAYCSEYELDIECPNCGLRIYIEGEEIWRWKLRVYEEDAIEADKDEEKSINN